MECMAVVRGVCVFVYGGTEREGGHGEDRGEDAPSQDRARGGARIRRAAAGGLWPGTGRRRRRRHAGDPELDWPAN